MSIKFISAIILALFFSGCSFEQNNIEVKKGDINQSDSLTNPTVDNYENSLPDSVIVEFLNDFYTEYITLFANYIGIEPLVKCREAVSDKKLIEKINNSDIDYDPFLNAQDAHEESVKSLEIAKCDEPDIFCISYLTGYMDKRSDIKLRVAIIEGEPKIVDIIGL